jgi:hypothetical protein
MASWGILFDRQRGHILDEFEAVFQRSWGINMVGQCKFTLPVKSPKNTLSNFQFGNHLVVFNDVDLPAWSGRLETPRTWGNKTNKHLALSHESIFFDRIGKYARPDGISGSAGKILREIIQIANATEDTLIRPGDIYNGGRHCGTFISIAVRLGDNINQILKQSGCEYEVVPRMENNRLKLYANLSQQLGVNTGASLNDSNCRIEEESLSEVGPIQNWIMGVVPDSQVRNHLMVSDPASIDRYGLRQAPYEVEFSGALEALTLQQIEVMKQPRRTFRATASKSGFLYSRLRNGNRTYFETAKYGYGIRGRVGTQADVRIMGMAYSDDIEGVALTLIEN